MSSSRRAPVPHRGPARLAGLALAGAALLLGAGSRRVGAQEAPPPPADSAAPAPAGVSPRGAFLRAVLVPGWGHASIESYRRGAFYVATEGAAAWALVKSRRRLAEAQGRVAFREALLRSELADEGVTDPAEVQERLGDDATLRDLRDLEEARRQQREDWTALGIFLLFLSGADAYVSAHLARFPAPLEVNVQPAGQGRVELSVGITLPR